MSAFTWMAWIKVGSLATSQYQRLYVERQGVGNRIRFAVAAWKGKLRFEVGPKDGNTDTNYDYSYEWDDRWHHIAFIGRLSGATPTYEMYLDTNQVRKGTLVVPSGTTAFTNTAPLGSIYLGNYSLHTSGGEVFSDSTYWNGKISDILIFNDAQPEGDILTYYGSNDIWDMGDTSMFSYWRLDENTGSSTVDADNGGWTGTLYQAGVASSALWTIDRPFLGNGTVDTTVPTTPTLPGSPTTNITSDGFTATWNATTDNVYVQFYELHVATVSDFSAYTTHNMDRLLTKVVTGLLPGTNYYWRVRAVDAENNTSGYTATQSLTTAGSGDLVAPLPPTNPVPSLITHNSFRVSWTASASSDETGYKIDIATDPGFTQYLSGYRNKDVTNVLFTDVLGASPLTTYYVRLRAYDAAENESVESVTLVLQTITIPDVNPPLPIEILDATSVSATAFTMNWLEGVDDVGIAYYLVDVATDVAFAQPVVHQHVTWTNVNVGNVLSYRLEDLTRETTYYYRVRGVDSAGNISQNAAEPVSVTTASSSIDEGGFIQTTFNPTADAYTNSGASSTNFGTANPLQVQGSGAAVTLAAYLRFDLSFLAGTIQSATLRMYVQNASAGDIRISVDNVSFDELTITHANAPTVSGLNIGFTPNATGAYVDVDIGTLFLDGPTVYTVRVWTNSTDNFTFDSREGTNQPELVVESDPSTATHIVDEHFHFHDHDGQVINHLTNPSGEDASITKWAGVGSVVAVVTNINTDFYHGARCFNVVCSGTGTNQGAEYTATEIVADDGQTWTGAVWLKSVSGSTNLRIRVREYTAAGALLAETDTTVVVSTAEWRRFSITRLLTNVSTARVGILIGAPNSTAATFKFDAAILSQTAHEPAYFDGDTSGASWSGTVKASTSRMGMAELHADSNYIGDGDGDNSVVAQIKRSDQTDWISLAGINSDFVLNRGTKVASALIGPSYGRYNVIENPSFEVDTFGWTLFNPNSNASIARTTDEAYFGAASLRLTVGVGAGSAITSSRVVAVPGEIYSARCRVKIPTGMTVRMPIRVLNSGGSYLANSTTVVGISELSGNDTWQELTEVWTLPASTAFVDVAIEVTSAIAGEVLIDTVILSKTTSLLVNNPYLDGTMVGGVWEGTAHRSTTGLILLPETSYDFKHIYTDPDGIVDNDNTLSVSFSDSHTTAAIADNVTTVQSMTVEPTTNDIYYSATYSGDDDNDMTVVVEYRRTDLSNWTAVIPTYERPAKHIHGYITNLKPGTSYTVRITFTDPEGTYGTNPLTMVTNTTTDLDTGESTSTIMFGGFLLMGRPDMKIGVSEHDAFGFPERRLQIEDLPRVDGAIELSNLWGQRGISMTGFVEGDDRGELEDNKNALKRALAPKLQKLVIDTLSNQGRYYNATCESLAIVERAGENIRHLVWDAQFTAADPFAYDTELTVLPEFTAGHNATATANNVGDLRIDPMIKIRTTNTIPVTLTILNQTTGERITPSATIINGDRLILDTNTLSVLKNGVEIDYAGGFPHLTTGSNVFKFTVVAASGTPTILVEMSWRHRYL